MSHGNFGWWKLLFLIYAELFSHISNSESQSLLLLFFFFFSGGGRGHYMDQILWSVVEFYISCCKKLVTVNRLFWQLGACLLAVAVVKRFKQESMYGHCREMTVSRGLIVFLLCLVFFRVYIMNDYLYPNNIHSKSPGLSRSLPDMAPISHSHVQVTKSPG